MTNMERMVLKKEEAEAEGLISSISSMVEDVVELNNKRERSNQQFINSNAHWKIYLMERTQKLKSTEKDFALTVEVKEVKE